MSILDKVIIEDSKLTACLAQLTRPLVFTNGVFDILHRGHVAYLEAARTQGASLVVGLNSDMSVRLLCKGLGRPINAELDRAFVLGGLSSVTLVVLFDEHTPLALMSKLSPDIYVKGGDYDMDSLEEAALIRSWGGRAMSIPFADGYSTTSLVRRIQSFGV